MIRSPRLLAAASLAAASLAAAAAFVWMSAATRPAPAEAVAASLLAVGDAGFLPEGLGVRHEPDVVGAALAAEDRRQPADALVLLGDNFYPRGLRADELVARIRANVVRPFCRFAVLDAPRSQEVADACPLVPDDRRSDARILAVLGNHDLYSEGSAALQREAVPQFVSSWHVLTGVAERVELPGSLSLVLVDSPALRQGRGDEELARSLAEARGEWLVLALHHPLVPADRDTSEAEYLRRVGAILAASPRRVHAVLAGHEHYLGVVQAEAPYPFLQVVAGSGGSARRIKLAGDGVLFTARELGFARLDRLGAGEGARLRATLYTVPRWRPWGPRARPRAAFAVDRQGRAERVDPPPPHR